MRKSAGFGTVCDYVGRCGDEFRFGCGSEILRVSQSDPTVDITQEQNIPSLKRELAMAETVVQDLKEVGAQDVSIVEHAYVTALWSATPKLELLPTFSFCCRLDTVWQPHVDRVTPTVHHYEGGKCTIGHDAEGEEVWISHETNTNFKYMVGWDPVTGDGTSLVGGDDKAGIAELMGCAQASQGRPLDQTSLYRAGLCAG